MRATPWIRSNHWAATVGPILSRTECATTSTTICAPLFVHACVRVCERVRVCVPVFVCVCVSSLVVFWSG